MKTCSIEGCDEEALCRGWCSKHYQRWLNNGDPRVARSKRPDGAGGVTGGYVVFTGNAREGLSTREHVAMAERAIGRKLPPGAQVHHVDSDPGNNAPGNLVLCPDQAYHRLLHVRTRALDACGNANYCKCVFCKAYDDPANLTARPKGAYQHRHCYNKYMRELRTR